MLGFQLGDIVSWMLNLDSVVPGFGSWFSFFVAVSAATWLGGRVLGPLVSGMLGTGGDKARRR